jgi:hypothetical protein
MNTAMQMMNDSTNMILFAVSQDLPIPESNIIYPVPYAEGIIIPMILKKHSHSSKVKFLNSEEARYVSFISFILSSEIEFITSFRNIGSKENLHINSV